ncbi:hypothetical protein D8I24_7957 [Cupriavidus necator H850]|nr:hypothetical protein D8I24_7957 [Cupriavidus necator H850]
MALASANDEVNLAGGIGMENQLYGQCVHVPRRWCAGRYR